MIGLKLTKHFGERWEERVGGRPPTSGEFDSMLRESIPLQPQVDLFTLRGRPYRVLAIYWHPVRDMIFKIDEKSRRVVTVLTPEMDGPYEKKTALMEKVG